MYEINLKCPRIWLIIKQKRDKIIGEWIQLDKYVHPQGEFLYGLLCVLTDSELQEPLLSLIRCKIPLGVFKQAIKESIDISRGKEWIDGLYLVMGGDAEIKYAQESKWLIDQILSEKIPDYDTLLDHKLLENLYYRCNTEEIQKAIHKELSGIWIEQITFIINNAKNYDELFTQLRDVYTVFHKYAMDKLREAITKFIDKLIEKGEIVL